MRNALFFSIIIISLQLKAQSPEIGLQLQMHGSSFVRGDNMEMLRNSFLHKGIFFQHRLSSRFLMSYGISEGKLGERRKQAGLLLPANPPFGPERITYYPGTEWHFLELPVKVSYFPIKGKGLFVYGMVSLAHLMSFLDVGGYSQLANGTFVLNYEENRFRFFEKGTYSMDFGGGLGYRFEMKRHHFGINTGFQSGVWNSTFVRLSLGASYYISVKQD